MERVPMTWGLDRKPTFAEAAAFGVPAALAGIREFNHWSRFSGSSGAAVPDGSAVCPSETAQGINNAETKTAQSTNLPGGGKTMFKSRGRIGCNFGKVKAPLVAKLLLGLKCNLGMGGKIIRTPFPGFR
jgi:hypothetical protein